MYSVSVYLFRFTERFFPVKQLFALCLVKISSGQKMTQIVHVMRKSDHPMS